MHHHTTSPLHWFRWWSGRTVRRLWGDSLLRAVFLGNILFHFILFKRRKLASKLTHQLESVSRFLGIPMLWTVIATNSNSRYTDFPDCWLFGRFVSHHPPDSLVPFHVRRCFRFVDPSPLLFNRPLLPLYYGFPPHYNQRNYINIRTDRFLLFSPLLSMFRLLAVLSFVSFSR